MKREYGVIDEILHQLSCLAFNNNPSWRWGGVMGLAACSIALGPEIASYLLAIVPPIISCFSDPDSKVRYFSCEGMYNVVKVAKGEILVYFNDLFDSLSKVRSLSQPLRLFLLVPCWSISGSLVTETQVQFNSLSFLLSNIAFNPARRRS